MLQVAASRPATLRIGVRRRRYRVGRRVRPLIVRVEPGVGSLELRLVLRSGRATARRRLEVHRPGTVWKAVLDQVRPSGRVPVRTGLQAFSVTIAPLPGVRVPRGPIGRVDSGTGAIRWLLASFSRILPAQRRAARSALDRLRRLIALPGRTAGHARGRHSPQEYKAKLVRVQAEIVSRLRGPTPRVVVSPMHPHKRWAAVTIPSWSATGDLVGCGVVFSDRGDSLEAPDFTMTLAHEVFHCHQAALAGTEQQYRNQHEWLFEGSADWVGAQVMRTFLGASARPSRVGDSISEYLKTPSKPLFTRTYDGHGFFAQLAWQGMDPWMRLPDMLRAENSAAAFADAVGQDPRRFLGAWGASFFRKPAWGHDWDLQGPAVSSTIPQRIALTVNVGGAASMRVGKLASAPLDVHGDADVVAMTVSKGVLRTRDAAGQDQLIASTQAACVLADADAYTCPAGSTRASPLTRPGPLRLALTGGMAGGEVTLRGYGLEKYCRSPAVQTAACRLHTRAELESLFGSPMWRFATTPVGTPAGTASACSYEFGRNRQTALPEEFLTVVLFTFSPNLPRKRVRAAFRDWVRSTAFPNSHAITVRGFDAAAESIDRGDANVQALRDHTVVWLRSSTAPAHWLRQAARLALPRLG